MYAEDAIVHCGCGGMKTITGREGFRAYWVDRLRQYPASELDNLQLGGTTCSSTAASARTITGVPPFIATSPTFVIPARMISISCK
nr:hypothetical protein [Bradyrhizobium sp. 139]